ncbi:MAG: PTS sugar transporter subunit IIA [Candidatus Cloacimonetes bacterium]|nr:PTS sugar transporter subunit IIA [Candidatus Cloacimonadota bacterium]
MQLEEVVRLECCTTDFQAKNKESALNELVKLVKHNSILKDIPDADILAALKKRENQGSTGFGKGIAIPHCQISGLDDFVVGIAIARKGVDFDAMDHKKVRIFVIIVGPVESRSGHLQLLAMVSRILKEPGIEDSLFAQDSKIGLLDAFLRNGPDTLAISSHGKDKLMLLLVHDPEIMDEIGEIFIEYGIEEATIIETSNMKSVLSHVPLFLGFFNFTGDRESNGKLLLLKLQRNYINALVAGLEDAFGNLDDFSGLSLVVLDIFYARGL